MQLSSKNLAELIALRLKVSEGKKAEKKVKKGGKK
jgi:hypothetical protein